MKDNKTCSCPCNSCHAPKFVKDSVDERERKPKIGDERLQGALRAEEQHNELTMQMAQKSLQNAKSEVAREIFAEIDVLLCRLINDKNYSIGEFAYDFCDLNEKYTKNK